MASDEYRSGRRHVDRELWLERLGRPPEQLSQEEREDLEQALRADPLLRQTASWIAEVDELARECAKRGQEEEVSEAVHIAAAREQILQKIARESPPGEASPGSRPWPVRYARFAAPAVVTAVLIGLFTLTDRDEVAEPPLGTATEASPPTAARLRTPMEPEQHRQRGRANDLQIQDAPLEPAAPLAKELGKLGPNLRAQLDRVRDANEETLDTAVAALLDVLESGEFRAQRSPVERTSQGVGVESVAGRDSIASVLREALPDIADSTVRDRSRRWLEKFDGSPD